MPIILFPQFLYFSTLPSIQKLLSIAELFFSSIFFSPLLFFRGGSSSQNLRKGDSRKAPNFSRIIGCPFSAAGYYSKKKKVWRFSCGKPEHNHLPTSDPRAHIKNQKLTDNEFEQVKNLSLSGLKPSDILQVMKKTQSANKPLLATKSTIYVAKQKSQGAISSRSQSNFSSQKTAHLLQLHYLLQSGLRR